MSTPSPLWLSSQVKLLPMLLDLFCECPELMSNPFPTSCLSLSSFPQPLQLPAVVIVFLLLSASLSQPGLFFPLLPLDIFTFNFLSFLSICLPQSVLASASPHPSPPQPSGHPAISFPCLNQSLPQRLFFF